MQLSIVDQLNEAFVASGWSVQQLLDESGLDIDRSSLHRKLEGAIPMKVTEAQVLATTLDVTIVWPRKKRAA